MGWQTLLHVEPQLEAQHACKFSFVRGHCSRHTGLVDIHFRGRAIGISAVVPLINLETQSLCFLFGQWVQLVIAFDYTYQHLPQENLISSFAVSGIVEILSTHYCKRFPPHKFIKMSGTQGLNIPVCPSGTTHLIHQTLSLI